MSKQTPMMQLRDSLKLKIREAIKTLPDSTFREVALRYDSLLKEIDDKYLPNEQQAFEDAVNDTYKTCQMLDKGIMPTPIDGTDYYNQKYKS